MKSLSQNEIQSFEDGEIVFREGEESSAMYVLRSGTIEILKDVAGHQIRLALLDRGSFFDRLPPPWRGPPAAPATRSRGTQGKNSV